MTDTLSTMAEFRQVDLAIAAIKKIKERTTKLPPVLVEAYKESLESASSAIVRRFFEGLASQCPDALEYFIDVDKQKKIEDEKQTKLETIS
jgi:RNA binding exosome subunit